MDSGGTETTDTAAQATEWIMPLECSIRMHAIHDDITNIESLASQRLVDVSTDHHSD